MAPNRIVARPVLFCVALLLLLVPACGKGKGDQEAQQQASAEESGAAFEYPSQLSRESSPEDVARVLIRALEEEDKETLAGLVAVKAEMAAVEAIYRRHGLRADTDPRSVAALAASGWSLTYAFMRPGETTVDHASVEGDSAVVVARATRADGAPCTLRIRLVREDGLWKVSGGIETGRQ